MLGRNQQSIYSILVQPVWSSLTHRRPTTDRKPTWPSPDPDPLFFNWQLKLVLFTWLIITIIKVERWWRNSSSPGRPIRAHTLWRLLCDDITSTNHVCVAQTQTRNITALLVYLRGRQRDRGVSLWLPGVCYRSQKPELTSTCLILLIIAALSLSMGSCLWL